MIASSLERVSAKRIGREIIVLAERRLFGETLCRIYFHYRLLK